MYVPKADFQALIILLFSVKMLIERIFRTKATIGGATIVSKKMLMLLIESLLLS